MQDGHVEGIGYPIKMSSDEYHQERKRLDEVYGQKGFAERRREQELAKLFARSGWTQQELAYVEGCSIGHIAHRLQFGKFLNWAECEKLSMDNFEETARIQLETMKERAFRGLWSQTIGSNERQRYQQVLKLMGKKTEVRVIRDINPGRDRSKAIRDAYLDDGLWHTTRDLVEEFGGTTNEMNEMLKDWTAHKGPCVAERKNVAGRDAFAYRFLSKEKSIHITEIREKLLPLIEELERANSKHNSLIDRGTIALMAARVRKLVMDWGS